MSCFPYVGVERGIRVLLAERTERRPAAESEKRLVALIVVGADQPELYQELQARYADTAGVTVIKDRRRDTAGHIDDQDRRHDVNLWIEGYLVVKPQPGAA